jgi:ankyrin repeat protein
MTQISADDLIDAIRKGYGDQVNAMLGAQPELLTAKTSSGVSAIQLAVYYRHPEIAETFLAHGARLSMAEACAMGKTEHVEALLKDDSGRANDWSPDGFPVLGLAVFFDHPDAARMLIEAGADVNAAATNAQKVAIIHSAVASRNFEIVRLLIEKGARVNVVQERDFTPLHEAAGQGNRAMTELLIEAGADPSARTADGHTPADIAEARQHRDMADWLRGLAARR